MASPIARNHEPSASPVGHAEGPRAQSQPDTYYLCPSIERLTPSDGRPSLFRRGALVIDSLVLTLLKAPCLPRCVPLDGGAFFAFDAPVSRRAGPDKQPSPRTGRDRGEDLRVEFSPPR